MLLAHGTLVPHLHAADVAGLLVLACAILIVCRAIRRKG